MRMGMGFVTFFVAGLVLFAQSDVEIGYVGPSDDEDEDGEDTSTPKGYLVPLVLGSLATLLCALIDSGHTNRAADIANYRASRKKASVLPTAILLPTGKATPGLAVSGTF